MTITFCFNDELMKLNSLKRYRQNKLVIVFLKVAHCGTISPRSCWAFPQWAGLNYKKKGRKTLTL